MLNPSTASISCGPRTKGGQASARSKSAQLTLSGAKVFVSCWKPPTAMRAIHNPLVNGVADRRPAATGCRQSLPSFAMIEHMEHAQSEPARGHGHAHARLDYGWAFAIGIALNLAYVVGEAIAGIISGSLALIADAGHNLSDVLSLSLAWGAAVLSRRQPSGRFTYGLRSSSILAALANAIILLVVTGGIAWEAFRRISDPVPVASGIVIAVAAVGIFVNGGTALLFASGAGDLNVKSAFLHLAADALVTAGVVVAGVAIWFTNWLWLDPAISLVVSAVIVVSTWGLLKSAIG